MMAVLPSALSPPGVVNGSLTDETFGADRAASTADASADRVAGAVSADPSGARTTIGSGCIATLG